jgi:hypothetical protein
LVLPGTTQFLRDLHQDLYHTGGNHFDFIVVGSFVACKPLRVVMKFFEFSIDWTVFGLLTLLISDHLHINDGLCLMPLFAYFLYRNRNYPVQLIDTWTAQFRSLQFRISLHYSEITAETNSPR